MTFRDKKVKGYLNKEQIAAIKEKVLIEWNKGFTKGQTEKKKRELLDEKIKTQVKITQKEQENARGAKAKASQQEKILKYVDKKEKQKLKNLEAMHKKLVAQEKTQTSQAALNRIKRQKEFVRKEMTRILGTARKDLLEAQAERQKDFYCIYY